MANIVWPDSLCPRSFSLQLKADIRTAGSVYGGSEIVNDLADDTWAAMMEVDSRSGNTAATLEALVNYLQGGLHTAEFGHFVRPQPRGTMLSTTLANAAAKGAESLTLTTTAGQTVKVGDMLSVSGLLLQVSETVTATGNTTQVKLVNRLRMTLTSGATASFNNPKIRWRLSTASSVQNLVGYTGPVTLNFVEDV
jgi:hypothetical protein